MIYRKRSHRRSVRNQNLMLGLHRTGAGLSSWYLLDTLMLCYLTQSRKGEDCLSLTMLERHPMNRWGVFLLVCTGSIKKQGE